MNSRKRIWKWLLQNGGHFFRPPRFNPTATNSYEKHKHHPRALTPWTHFTKSLWAHDWNIMKTKFALNLFIMIKPGCSFAHATTAELSWHVQNCNWIWWLFVKKKKTIFFSGDLHNGLKAFVKWISRAPEAGLRERMDIYLRYHPESRLCQSTQNFPYITWQLRSLLKSRLHIFHYFHSKRNGRKMRLLQIGRDISDSNISVISNAISRLAKTAISCI